MKDSNKGKKFIWGISLFFLDFFIIFLSLFYFLVSFALVIFENNWPDWNRLTGPGVLLCLTTLLVYKVLYAWSAKKGLKVLRWIDPVFFSLLSCFGALACSGLVRLVKPAFFHLDKPIFLIFFALLIAFGVVWFSP